MNNVAKCTHAQRWSYKTPVVPVNTHTHTNAHVCSNARTREHMHSSELFRLVSCQTSFTRRTTRTSVCICARPPGIKLNSTLRTGGCDRRVSAIFVCVCTLICVFFVFVLSRTHERLLSIKCIKQPRGWPDVKIAVTTYGLVNALISLQHTFNTRLGRPVGAQCYGDQISARGQPETNSARDASPTPCQL